MQLIFLQMCLIHIRVGQPGRTVLGRAYPQLTILCLKQGLDIFTCKGSRGVFVPGDFFKNRTC